ncbi:MAG: ABC transporter substrate-binding protein, partial [Steroidobacteraceae bacterium]
NAPGGNATGVSIFTTELAMKRLELLQELLKIHSLASHTFALLVNPSSDAIEIEINESLFAAKHFGLELMVLRATSVSGLDAAFNTANQKKVSALLISADPYFNSQRDQIVALAARHALPTMYPLRAYCEAGGLVSYGTKLSWAYQQVGAYCGRILKGAKPSELPVQLPTTFELVINLKTAKALGMTVPTSVLARADEGIE